MERAGIFFGDANWICWAGKSDLILLKKFHAKNPWPNRDPQNPRKNRDHENLISWIPINNHRKKQTSKEIINPQGTSPVAQSP
jgi:hypothetical protein